MQRTQMRIRKKYLLITIILFTLEAIIALYVHDKIIRPYIGDAIVVILLYYLIRIFFPTKIRLLPLYIFLFAVSVEVLQYFRFIEIIGLENNSFFKTMTGTSFSFIDILCYAIGCAFVCILEIRKYKHSIKK